MISHFKPDAKPKRLRARHAPVDRVALSRAIDGTLDVLHQLEELRDAVQNPSVEYVRIEHACNLIDAALAFLFAVEDGEG